MPITNRFLEPTEGGRKDEIRHYNIDLDQEFDRRTGHPIGRPVLNNIVISIVRQSEENAPFYIDWQLEPTKQHTLKICFYDDNNLIRTIDIKDAYLVGYTQDSSAPGEIEETLVISPSVVVFDGVTYDRKEYL